MSEREVFLAFPAVIGAVLIIGGLLFLLSRFLLVRRRVGGGTFLARRRAGERGGCLFLLSMFAIASALLMGLSWGGAALIFRETLFRPIVRGDNDLYGINIPRETLTAAVWTLTPSMTPTASPPPTDLPTLTPSPPPTASPLPTASLTPAASPIPIATNTRSPTHSVIPTRTPALTQIDVLAQTARFSAETTTGIGGLPGSSAGALQRTVRVRPAAG
jgi:hypothetical protein